MLKTANEKNSVRSLLKSGVKVINFGLEGFYDDLREQKAAAVQMNWAPKTADKNLLAKLKLLKKN